MKVLMVKTSSLGDIIHAFPILSFLHQEFPHVQIDWVVEKSFADMVYAHPLVNKVIEIDTKHWRTSWWKLKTWQEIFFFRRCLKTEKYDLVIDLQGNTKSAIPTFLARSKNKVGFGLKTVHEWPNTLVTHHRFNPPLHLNVREENLYIVQHYFQRYGAIQNEKIILKLTSEQQKIFQKAWSKISSLPGQKILVCPGSAWKNKQLSYQTLKDFLLKICHSQDVTLLLAWGTAEERTLVQKLEDEIKENIFVLEKFPLPVLQNLMSKIEIVIAMDSLPLHLAGISGTATFSIFGASSAQKYKPIGLSHYAVQGSCPYGRTFERRCPILRSCPTGFCIQNLLSDDLFQKFCQWKKENFHAFSLCRK